MKKISMVLILLFLSTASLLAQKEGQALIDSLKDLISRTDDSKIQAQSLEHLSFAYHTINPDSGIYFGKKSLRLSKKIKWKRGEAEANNSVGLNYWKKSDFHKALDFYTKSMKLNDELGRKSGLSANYLNIGIIYYQWSDYPKALEYYFKAQKVDEELGSKSGMATNYGNIGFIYLKMADYKSAMTYFRKALKIEKKLKNKGGMAYNYGYIAEAYKSIGNIDQAMKNFRYAYDIDSEIGNTGGLSSHIVGLASCYLMLGDYDKSVKHYYEALDLYKSLGNRFGESVIFGEIGNLYLKSSEDTNFTMERGKSPIYQLSKIDRLKKALKFFNKAILIDREIHDQESLINWYKGLQKVYVKLDNYKKAYEYHVKYSDVKDSVFNKEKSKEIGRLEAQREILAKEYKEKEEARKIAEEITYRNNIQYSGIGIFVLLLFISIFIIPNLDIPFSVVDGLVFITFLLFYELITVIAEPYIDSWTNNVPIYKLGMNLGIAVLFIPFHNFEKRLRNRYTGKSK